MKRILVGLALVGLGMFASAGHLAAQQFMGFELLDLDGALVRWSSAVPVSAASFTCAAVTAVLPFISFAYFVNSAARSCGQRARRTIGSENACPAEVRMALR